MTPADKQLVKASWAKVLPCKEATAKLFYNRLFDQHPSFRALFKGDMRHQEQKLMIMINQAVNLMDNFSVVVPPLQRAGIAHKAFGVKAEDYDKFAKVFLCTLDTVLGDDFTDDVKSAWKTTFDALASVMIKAANDESTDSGAVQSVSWWKKMLRRQVAYSNASTP